MHDQPLVVIVHIGIKSVFIFCSHAGNFYNHLVNDSVDAANLLGNDLTSAVEDIQALHRPFFDSSLPAVMQDMFINSLSHIRSNKYLLIDGHRRSNVGGLMTIA